MNQNHDIALVGGGLSNTSTLYELIKNFENSKNALKFHPRIRIFDIRKDFFSGGEAYAGSAPEMLFTNTFDTKEIFEKVEGGELLHHLAKWLTEKQASWVDKLQKLNNNKVNRWLDENKEKLASQKFDELHLPRIVLSWFIEETLYETIERAKKLGVSVELIQGEVSDIERSDSNLFHIRLGYHASKVIIGKDASGHITFSTSKNLENSDIDANSVVLATGLPSKNLFPHLLQSENFYNSQTTEPHNSRLPHESIVKKINALYEIKKCPVEIGCIGAGPSFLDVVMLLDDDNLRGKYELVSYSKTGVMRHNSAEKIDHTAYVPRHLGGFDRNGIFVPKQFLTEEAFFDALDTEMDCAHENGFGSQDVELMTRYYAEQVLKTDSSAYNPTSKERGRVKLRNHLKQTDPNTARTVKRLQEYGQLRTVASRLESSDITADTSGLFNVSPKESAQEEFDILINCTPRKRLSDAPLIKHALEKELIHIYHHGDRDYIEIDEQNRGSTGIYLGGALVVDHVRNGEWIEGDVGIGAIMRHAKRISRGIINDMMHNRLPTATTPIILP